MAALNKTGMYLNVFYRHEFYKPTKMVVAKSPRVIRLMKQRIAAVIYSGADFKI